MGITTYGHLAWHRGHPTGVLTSGSSSAGHYARPAAEGAPSSLSGSLAN